MDRRQVAPDVPCHIGKPAQPAMLFPLTEKETWLLYKPGQRTKASVFRYIEVIAFVERKFYQYDLHRAT